MIRVITTYTENTRHVTQEALSMDKEKLIESAKEFDVDIEFNADRPGVYDKNSGSFFTFEELLGDVKPYSESNDKNQSNKKDKS